MAADDFGDDTVTVDSVRSELRTCVFRLCFEKTMHDIEQTETAKIAAPTIMNILAFGVNSKLITREEFNDWAKAASGEETIANVAQKYGMMGE